MAGLLVAGAALRLWQYAGNPALWMDELAIAHNLMTRSVVGLVSAPLDDSQIAPPGFLVVSRALVVAFGSSEYVLRLFPLLCSLAALPFQMRIARRVLAPAAAVLAVALFALSGAVAVFAAEAKQYASDVLVIVLLTDLALQWLETPTRRRLLGLTVAGMVGVWFSQPAVLVLVGLGLALLLSADSSQRRALVPMLLLWAVLSGLSVIYARARMSSGLMAFMNWFWREGFMPWPTQSAGDVLWPLGAVRGVFDLLLDFPWPTLYCGLALAGVGSLLLRRRASALVLLLPVGVTLAAAVAHAFPFSIRVVLFVVPPLLVFVAEGAWCLGKLVRLPVLERVAPFAAALPPIVALARNPPVWRFDDVRPVLAELQRQRQSGDVIYVYYPSWQAVRFYGPRYGLPLESVDLGSCHRELRAYLRELDRYRGRERFWFLTAFERTRVRETPAMLDYLDIIGVRKLVIEGPPTTRPGATSQGTRWRDLARNAAYLYDLSDPVRLASATAISQQLPPVQLASSSWCVYGPPIPQVPTIGKAESAGTQ